MSTEQPFKQADHRVSWDHLQKVNVNVLKSMMGTKSINFVCCACSTVARKRITRVRWQESYHRVEVGAKRADPASCLAAVSWQLVRSWALQRWRAPSSTQGPQKPNALCWLSSLLMLETAPGTWTTLDKLSGSGPGSSCKRQEKRFPGAGDRGQLLVGSEAWRATSCKGARMGGSCCWAPHICRGETASLTRCFLTTSLTKGLGFRVKGLNWTKCFSYSEENIKKKKKNRRLGCRV